ncbi:hypothetical protein H5410_045899 [Solanum commersonii]|uniref:Putative plant transposon protein domain-containing protein n=1 Tax=Solanum commersonii TaxID=4109 RepID=A0A9J5XAT3_SOLCO|nr:hypothetical protein H5410_045899 [Solanum commersonii]
MDRDPRTYSEEIMREFYAFYAATLRGSIDKRSKPQPRNLSLLLWSKATLNFVDKLFWLLVRNRVSPTKVDNKLTWDKAVMVATLVAGLEIDFARMLLAEIHERAFKTSTTYPFPCLISQLYRDSGVPIWHCDRLIHPTGTLDVGLIRDEVNVATPHKGPRIDVPLGTNLADAVEQM